MLTDQERLLALCCNLKNWSWDVSPQYRLEKEDAQALLTVLQQIVEGVGQRGEEA